MKKTLAILLVALIGFGYTAESRAEFKFGPRVGLNVNKMALTGVTDFVNGENACGFTAGVQAEYMLPVISLGVDLSLMYSYMDPEFKAGKKGVGTMDVNPDPGKHFLEIPLNIKYKIGIPVIASIMRPYIFTGPCVAFKLDKSDKNADIKTKTTQWTWNVGLGLEFIKHIQIGASYGFGINNIMDGVEIGGTTVNAGDIKARNNYWTVTAAYLF